ncbi:MAG: sodium:solute symporter family protein [Prolixibacteraceae bacterium]|nr:sodium:solute symporter family protein [Prolixibacteraceae bacterium]
MFKYFILLLYILAMIGIGIYSSRKIRTSGDYMVAGNKGNVWQITGSLLATIIGSTAILGSSDLAFSQGWAAAWLMLSAALGLLLLVLVAPIVKRQGKYTLPQLIGDQYGKEAKIIASLVIPVAWIGVIAAQIIGGAKVMNSFFGLPYESSVWGIGILFIFYTAVGGQVSVIKTDLVQSFIIILGVLAIACYLFFLAPVKPGDLTQLKFPFNNAFRPMDLFVLFLTYSTTFLVGPDIYTRLFCAENEKVARRSVLLTALILIPFAFMITYLGVFAAHQFPGFDFKQGSSLISVLSFILPDWGIGVLVAAILSAIMSSASTTLLTSSVIVANTIHKDLDTPVSLRQTKLIMLLLGLLSILLSLRVTSIVQSLLMALTFFSGAFIIPVLAGLLGFRNNRLRSNMAMILGGMVALAGKITGIFSDSKIGNLIILGAFCLNGILLFPGGKWIKTSKTSE